MDTLFSSDDPSIYDIRTDAPGPSGQLPLTPRMLRTLPSGDIFGWTQDAGMGVESGPPRTGRVPHPQHAGRHSRRGRLARRARIPHGSLRGGPPDARGGGRAARARRHTLCRVLQRPVRRADAGNPRNDGLASLPQRRSASLATPHQVPADSAWRDRRRDLRQGSAGHDDGTGVHATICRAFWCREA